MLNWFQLLRKNFTSLSASVELLHCVSSECNFKKKAFEMASLPGTLQTKFASTFLFYSLSSANCTT